MARKEEVTDKERAESEYAFHNPLIGGGGLWKPGDEMGFRVPYYDEMRYLLYRSSEMIFKQRGIE